MLSVLYGIAAVASLFTGFGNMPLWGRYYVADVPGLGWSGDFFINVNVHILAGSLLLAIGAYAVTASLMDRRSNAGKLTRSGTLRAVLLALAIATGFLMVLKNLPGIHFSMAALVIFNFTHMAAAVLFMIAALVSLVFRQPWRHMR
jgi:putative Mn2+ efflux pump MntP